MSSPNIREWVEKVDVIVQILYMGSTEWCLRHAWARHAAITLRSEVNQTLGVKFTSVNMPWDQYKTDSIIK